METILVPGTRVSDLTVADLGPWEDDKHPPERRQGAQGRGRTSAWPRRSHRPRTVGWQSRNRSGMRVIRIRRHVRTASFRRVSHRRAAFAPTSGSGCTCRTASVRTGHVSDSATAASSSASMADCLVHEAVRTLECLGMLARCPSVEGMWKTWIRINESRRKRPNPCLAPYMDAGPARKDEEAQGRREERASLDEIERIGI